MTDAWLVLRCSGPSTLPLARSLSESGLEVWTPTETSTRRVPRANVKRRLTVALLPSYVFARATHLAELLSLASNPTGAHKGFSVWHTADKVPLIADASLEPLRTVERKRTPMQRQLTPGEKVRLRDGGFEGLTGQIEGIRGQYAMVAIPGFRMPIKIAAWHILQEEPVSSKRLAA